MSLFKSVSIQANPPRIDIVEDANSLGEENRHCIYPTHNAEYGMIFVWLLAKAMSLQGISLRQGPLATEQVNRRGGGPLKSLHSIFFHDGKAAAQARTWLDKLLPPDGFTAGTTLLKSKRTHETSYYTTEQSSSRLTQLRSTMAQPTLRASFVRGGNMSVKWAK